MQKEAKKKRIKSMR